ncbi:heat shock transcription factor, Y-linked [Nomia melanderi]|uniref:heat shock transcription factor, Y-linked n=1 Tax=Nomia melanderi TaxID=2448451 RepID=UPI0013043292|nr:heat shock transcription factor, Y-linked-like [Nomia melanderi]
MYDDCMFLSLRFPQKLWRIVNEYKSDAVRWSLSGTTILLDYKKFQEQYLDPGNSIFKTKNITSFIRQLNLYGFRKVTSHNRDPICNAYNPDVHEFLHGNFRIGRPDLLSRVYRKTPEKLRHRQRIGSKGSPESTTTNKNFEHESRLHMCRLALTKALEQVRREYQRTHHLTRNIDFLNDPAISHEKVFAFNLYPTESHDGKVEWIGRNPISIASKRNNANGHASYNWCVYEVNKSYEKE